MLEERLNVSGGRFVFLQEGVGFPGRNVSLDDVRLPGGRYTSSWKKVSVFLKEDANLPAGRKPETEAWIVCEEPTVATFRCCELSSRILFVRLMYPSCQYSHVDVRNLG